MSSGIASSRALGRDRTHLIAVIVLFAAAALVVAVALYRVSVAVPNRSQLGHVAGIWLTMATDLSGGEFYRPIVSDDGYGGGRYFPLFFVANAALMKLGPGPIVAGYAVALASAVALLIGVWLLLRRLGVGALVAVPVSVLAFSTNAMQYGITTIRGDMLPAALNIWGLVFAVGLMNRSSGESAADVASSQIDLSGNMKRDCVVWWAALFFALAFIAKVTAVFGFAAAFAALLLSGRRRDAWKLFGLTLAGMWLLLSAAALLSGGRLIEYMIECGSGGTDLAYALRAPLNALNCFLKDDPWSLTFIVLAVVALIANLRRAWRTLHVLALVATAIATVALFASQGIDFNHLVDVQVIAVVAFAVVALSSRRWILPGACALAIAATVCSANALRTFGPTDRQPAAAQMKEVLDVVPRSGGLALRSLGEGRPLLAENNMIPIINNERPFMLDSYSFRVVAERRPEVGRLLQLQLSSHKYRAVVLYHDPETAQGKQYLEERHFGKGFADALPRHYVFSARIHGFWVYIPRHLETVGN